LTTYFSASPKDINEMRKELSTVVTEVDNLQRGQEHIEERLDEMMTRSEVKDQNIKIKEHDRRIRVLEKKVLFAR
jgi:regulator of replication initiation timing